MAYADARARVSAVLAGLSITSPAALSIQRVYQDPPAGLEDLPCFILYGSAGFYDYTLGSSIAEETETERCRLVIGDADVARAVEIARAFRVALLAAFETEAGLGGHAVISRIEWEEVGALTYGAHNYRGLDFLITFQVKAP